MVEGARLEIVYVLKEASRVRIPLSPPTGSDENLIDRGSTKQSDSSFWMHVRAPEGWKPPEWCASIPL